MVQTVGSVTDAYVTKVDGTKTSFVRKYGMSAIDITFFNTQEAASDAYKGSASVTMGITAGANATGLANDATAYTATATVDGVDQAISIVGSAAQTITTLLSELNTDLTGVTAAIDGKNIKLLHNTGGENKQVTITDISLFKAVTGYVAIDSPIAGGLQGLLETINHPSTGIPAWMSFKTAVQEYDSASFDAKIAVGTTVADNGMEASYTEATQDKVLNIVNALVEKAKTL